MPRQSLLFNDFDVFSVMENQKAALRQKIASAPESFTASSDNDVIARFVKEFEFEIPELKEAEMTMTEREVDVDVSHDHRRFFSRSGPFFIKGTEITVHIPFTGDRDLFRVQPSTYTLSPPRGDIKGSELLIRFEFPNDIPPPDLKVGLERNLQEIRTYLNNLRSSQGVLQTQLEAEAKTAWDRRKADFTTRMQAIGALGIPRRQSPETSKSHNVSATPAALKSEQISKSDTSRTPKAKWHVFISHASEDKQAIAKPLADALIAAGLLVWYDDYSLTVGDSLRQKIEEGLSKSQFGIVILSQAFLSKHWPQQELNGLAAREVGGKKVILPVWHDISRNDIAEASPILADRLGVPTSLGIPHVVAKLIEAMNR